MRVVFLNYYSGLLNRGGESFVHELANHLSLNNQVSVFQSGNKSPDSHYEVISKKAGSVFLFTLKCLPLLLKTKPDIVFPLNGRFEVLICRLYVSFSKAKLVIAGQSGPGFDDRWNLLMKPHVFVALTNRQFDWAQKASFWKQKIVKISNGVDMNKFNPTGSKAKVPLKNPVILIVAAPTVSKRVEQTIKAVAKLDNASLLLLGTGSLNKKIDSLGKNLLGPNRFFHTSVSHEEMPKYYRCADVFTLCSKSSEAFGIVYIEAMASGLACVATDDVSRREIIGQAGEYVSNPSNATEYAKALKKALSKNWGNIPKLQAEKYSWDNITAQYEKLFQQI